MTLKVLEASSARLIKDGFSTKVFDFVSYYASNILVGNEWDVTAVEVANGELVLKALEDSVVAVTGRGRLFVNDREMPLWQALPMPKGARLRLVSERECAIYLGVAGGFMGEDGVAPGATLEYGPSRLTIKELMEEVPARRIPERVVREEIYRRELKAVVPNGDAQMTRLLSREKFVLAGKKLGRIAVLKPLNGFFRMVPVSTRDRPRSGSLVVNSGRVLVTYDGLTTEQPVFGMLNAGELEKISRLKIGEMVKIRAFSSLKTSVINEYIVLVEKISRCVAGAVEALRRGAKLVRVAANGRVFEAWVEEIT